MKELFDAISRRDLKLASQLADGMKPEELNNVHDDTTALILALEIDDLGIANILYDKGASIEASLFQAIKSGNYQVTNHLVKTILQKQGSLNDIYNGETPLTYAIKQKNVAASCMLIDMGVDILKPNKLGRTPFEVFVLNTTSKYKSQKIENENYNKLIEREYVSILPKMLIELGKNNRQNEAQESLNKALYLARTTIVTSYLISGGADVNAKLGEHEITPVMNFLLSNSEYHEESTLKIMINDPSFDINITDKYGKTALIYAAQNQNPYAVKILLEKGAEVTIENNNGDSALLLALQHRPFHIGNQPNENTEEIINMLSENLINSGKPITLDTKGKLDYALRQRYHITELSSQGCIMRKLIDSIPISSDNKPSGTNP